MDNKNGVIYGLRCVCHDEGYRYIGKSIVSDRGRLRSHKYNARRDQDLPVYRWMRKHGPENIEIETLERVEGNEALLLREIAWIADLGTHVSEGGLNCTRGGDGSLGWKQTAESIAKANAARTARRGYEGRKPHKPRPRMDPELRRQSILASRARGSASGSAKLTEENVADIKMRLRNGEQQRALAAEFGVTQGNICSISKGRTWKHVPWPEDGGASIVYSKGDGSTNA